MFWRDHRSRRGPASPTTTEPSSETFKNPVPRPGFGTPNPSGRNSAAGRRFAANSRNPQAVGNRKDGNVRIGRPFASSRSLYGIPPPLLRVPGCHRTSAHRPRTEFEPQVSRHLQAPIPIGRSGKTADALKNGVQVKIGQNIAKPSTTAHETAQSRDIALPYQPLSFRGREKVPTPRSHTSRQIDVLICPFS